MSDRYVDLARMLYNKYYNLLCIISRKFKKFFKQLLSNENDDKKYGRRKLDNIKHIYIEGMKHPVVIL